MPNSAKIMRLCQKKVYLYFVVSRGLLVKLFRGLHARLYCDQPLSHSYITKKTLKGKTDMQLLNCQEYEAHKKAWAPL